MIFKGPFLSRIGAEDKPVSNISAAREKVTIALQMFKNAVDDIDQANILLDDSIAKDDEQIKEATERKLLAEDHLSHNVELRNKMSEFLPKQ